MKQRFIRGFTLIELLITISIIAILSAIAFGLFTTAIEKSRDAKRQSDLRTIQSALEQYFADQGYYPQSLVFGRSLEFGGRKYINTLPNDPIVPPNYCYKPLRVLQECALVTPDCDNAVLANRCVNYCLFAKLENPAPGTDKCGTTEDYNLIVRPP